MGAGTSVTSSVHHVPLVLEKMKDQLYKRKKDKVRGLGIISKIADKSSANRVTMVEQYDMLNVCLSYNTRQGMVGSAAMNTIAVIAKEKSLAPQILDTLEMAIVNALSSDEMNFWKDPTSKQSWAILSIQRIIKNEDAALRLIANGIVGVIQPLLDLDENDADLAIMDTTLTLVILSKFLRQKTSSSSVPESDDGFNLPIPSQGILAMIIDAIDCITSGIDGNKVKLGRYELSMLIEALIILTENNELLVTRIMNDH